VFFVRRFTRPLIDIDAGLCIALGLATLESAVVQEASELLGDVKIGDCNYLGDPGLTIRFGQVIATRWNRQTQYTYASAEDLLTRSMLCVSWACCLDSGFSSPPVSSSKQRRRKYVTAVNRS
jgi:hypothetical protein